MNTTQVLSELQFLDKYSRFDYQKGRRENWQETVTRVTDFLLSYLPEKERVTVGELIFNSILNKEVSPSMRLMATAGEAAKLNEASIFNCFGRETEFITEFGTKSFFDFNDGDEVLVKTHDSSWKKAVVRNFGKQTLNEITLRRLRSEKKVRATSNHEWILNNGKRTVDLSVGENLIGLPDEISNWSFDESTPEEKIAWCYGFVYGDGVVGNNHSMVRLCGNDNRFLERFLQCGFGSTTSMSLVGDNIVFTGKYLKTTPELSIENIKEVRAFVIGYLDADAAKSKSVGRNKYISLQSSQVDHINFIESAFEMVGVYLLNKRDLTGKETNFGVRPETKIFGLTSKVGNTNTSWKVVNITKNVSTEDVWCLVVEENHSFILSGGIVTGNCSYLPLESTQDFHDLTLLLGLGVGVGFSVENHFVGSLGVVKEQNKDRTVKFVVPDSIYGWAQSIKYLLENKMAGNRVHFDYSLIRPAGSPLKTRGGRACLTGDTIVYKDRKKPKEQNEVTLDYLFWLKNNSPENFSKIKIRSLDEETGVFYRNKLIDIFYNGVAPVYLVETENGYKIKATNNHRFMDDTGRYKFLSMFSVNERIAVNGKDFGCFCFDCGTTISRRSKRCKDCDRKSRLKIDALETTCRRRKEVRSYRNENNFCELCNSSLGLEVHHVDKNPRNNHVSNLQVLCSKCHHKIHLIDKLFGNPYKQKFVSYDRIINIKFVGYEKVYDLQMMSPNHNFVANGFVSHNSGPEPLMDAHIAIGRVLDERAGKEIRSIDAFDIACHIAGAIVSGGVRRCLPSGSLVHTQNGMVPIENVEVGTSVLTSKGYFPVTNKFEQGLQKIVRVVTQDSSFECTPNHKIAVLTSKDSYVWKTASELQFGDKLIAPSVAIDGSLQSMPSFSYIKPKNSTTCKDIVIPELDEDMAWLLGLLHGDGFVGKNEVTIPISGEQVEIGVRAKKQLERFGVNVGLTEHENYFVLRVKSKQLATYFGEWLKTPKSTIFIPNFIWNSNYDIKIAYVSGVMDADGSAKSRPINVVTTVYEDFAKQIQLLLSSCGVQSRIKRLSESNLQENWKPKFAVNLINNASKLAFLESPKLFKNEFAISKSEQRTNTFDGVVWSKTDSPFIPVTFIRLEDVLEESETWDLEVEVAHEFFAQGYLVHNSAMITIFDIDDELMLGAKSGDNFSKNLQRQYANISAVIDEELSEEEMSKLIQRMHDSGFGEPGIFSRYAARQTMPERRKAVFGIGTNPSL